MRYFFLSFFGHAILLLALVAAQMLYYVPKKKYYMVDFVIGGSGNSSEGASNIEAAGNTENKNTNNEIAHIRARAQNNLADSNNEKINPKQDILVKSSKVKKKKQLMEIPSAPSIPVPSAPIPSPIAKTANLQNNSLGSGSGSGGASGIGGSGNGLGNGSGNGWGGDGTSGIIGNFPYAWYVNQIRKKIDSNWDISEGFPIKISAEIGFTILRNGSIENVEIEKSSGNKDFDKLAMRAIEYCYPFAPLPSTYREANLRVHIKFSLKKS